MLPLHARERETVWSSGSPDSSWLHAVLESAAHIFRWKETSWGSRFPVPSSEVAIPQNTVGATWFVAPFLPHMILTGLVTLERSLAIRDLCEYLSSPLLGRFLEDIHLEMNKTLHPVSLHG